MRAILLDTNIISFVLKGDSRALDYNLPLATHNPKDFVDIPDLEIITTVMY